MTDGSVGQYAKVTDLIERFVARMILDGLWQGKGSQGSSQRSRQTAVSPYRPFLHQASDDVQVTETRQLVWQGEKPWEKLWTASVFST